MYSYQLFAYMYSYQLFAYMYSYQLFPKALFLLFIMPRVVNEVKFLIHYKLNGYFEQICCFKFI